MTVFSQENAPPKNLKQTPRFSVLNSFLMVLFLVGLVSMILMRTLRKDYARYMQAQVGFWMRSKGEE